MCVSKDDRSSRGKLGLQSKINIVQKKCQESVLFCKAEWIQVSSTQATLQICASEIPRNHCIFVIFVHWFKCTNCSLYDMISKIQLEIPYICCTWDSNQIPKRHWKCMGEKHDEKLCFYKQFFCSLK